MKFKGYPVPDGLIEAINDGKWEKASKLFKKLREGFLYFVEHDELPSGDIEASKKEKEFFPAPNDTKWSNVHFRWTEELQIKIRINNKEQLFSITRLAKKFHREPSRNLLLRIIRVGGMFDKSILDDKNQVYLKHYVSNLRKDLKELFDISENPIESAGEGNYTTIFQTSSALPPPDNDDWDSE